MDSKISKAERRPNKKLRALRMAAGLTTAKLGAAVGYDANYLRCVERGEYRMSEGMAILLADYFNVPVAELTGGDGE